MDFYTYMRLLQLQDGLYDLITNFYKPGYTVQFFIELDCIAVLITNNESKLKYITEFIIKDQSIYLKDEEDTDIFDFNLKTSLIDHLKCRLPYIKDYTTNMVSLKNNRNSLMSMLDFYIEKFKYIDKDKSTISYKGSKNKLLEISFDESNNYENHILINIDLNKDTIYKLRILLPNNQSNRNEYINKFKYILKDVQKSLDYPQLNITVYESFSL